MKMAQKASSYHLYPQMDRGMMLIEHRRCFNEIIEFCNTLAYHGLLEAKKGFSVDMPFAPMQFELVSGSSKVMGPSRANTQEANAIASWLAINGSILTNFYQQKENSAALEEKRSAKRIRLADVVGIVTPFTGQKFELKRVLAKSGLDTSGMTIGTVHALQGAERAVVLFSSTYGENDAGKGYFFDRGVNMLNVAVSRAKDAFVLFGSVAVFNKSSSAPSSLLYRYITK